MRWLNWRQTSSQLLKRNHKLSSLSNNNKYHKEILNRFNSNKIRYQTAWNLLKGNLQLALALLDLVGVMKDSSRKSVDHLRLQRRLNRITLWALNRLSSKIRTVSKMLTQAIKTPILLQWALQGFSRVNNLELGCPPKYNSLRGKSKTSLMTTT